MGRLYDRNGIYHAHYYVYHDDGRRELRRETTGCSDRRAAEQWLAQAERRATNPTRKKAPVSLESLLQLYLDKATFKSPHTAKMRAQKLMNVSRLLGYLNAHAFSKKDVLGFVNERRQELVPGTRRTVTDHTIVKELVSLSVALKFAQEQELWDGDVAKLIPRISSNYVPRDTFLTPEQYARMKECLPFKNARVRYALWCDLAVYLGGNYSEIVKLEWPDLNLSRRVAHLRGTKTKRRNRYVPIPEPLLEVLRPIQRDAGVVVGSWPNIYRELRVACERASVPRVTSNDLRRTYASWLVQQGVALKHVAELMGHTTTHMVDTVYGRLNMETLEAATERLPAMVAPKVEEPVQVLSRTKLIEVD